SSPPACARRCAWASWGRRPPPARPPSRGWRRPGTEVALGAADAGGARARLGRALPVLTVLALGVALMYPVALWLGLPLARKRMENLANWLVTTTAAHPLAAVPDDPASGAAPGARLTFGGAAELEAAAGAPERLVLVKDGAPLAAPFGF